MHPGIHAKHHPDKPALIVPSRDVTVTYRELDESSNRAAQLFRSLGLVPGDGIAILLENHPRFYEVVWGAQRSGLYYTPMSTRLTPGEAEYIVADCDAKVLVTSKALAATASGSCAFHAAYVASFTSSVRARRSVMPYQSASRGHRRSTR